MPDTAFKPVSDQAGRMVESSWKRILAIAQNHVQDFENNSTASLDSTSEFYDRERHMVHALDTLFSLAYEGPGYLAFISTITNNLEPESPVAMAFLSHIIDRAALPSRETMSSVSPTIISKFHNTIIKKKQNRIHRLLTSFMHKPSKSGVKQDLKLNAAILWSLLAEKFAGEMCLLLYQPDVSHLLITSITNKQEDVMVRIFALLALEKFALTGVVKERIMSHTEFNIRSILLSVLEECDQANERIILEMDQEEKNKIIIIPSKGELRVEWAKYAQLRLCTKWALDYVFIDVKKVTCPWDLSCLNIIMNPFDSTPHLKIGGNGLELRNDRPHFESVRATACVKKDKWYYETLLLSNGIMQIGWATSRCRFSPEEGYGVGDDCNGFAFDTYRTAVWADGSAVYPQSKVKIRCQAGDVIGSFLDLDNGFCSYYINGRDLGLTVEFEHPNRLNKEEEESDSDSKYESAQSSIPSPPQKKMTGLGLYPAISLTTYQQALVNFGEKGWMYDPPTSTSFKGICEAGALDPTFSRRVMRWVQKRGVTSYKLPLRPKMGAEECQDQDDLSASPKSDASDDDDDWDGPLCTICFSEPKDTILMPCRHDGIGGRCAKLLTMCHLCRADIVDRILVPLEDQNS